MAFWMEECIECLKYVLGKHFKKDHYSSTLEKIAHYFMFSSTQNVMPN